MNPFYQTLDALERESGALYSPPRVMVAPGTGALEFLRAVYQNDRLPLMTRMRAAEAALPFERPKLAAVLSASIPGEEFGSRLEAARKRLVEGPPSTPSKAPLIPTDPRGLPVVADRRFRRI